MKKNRIICLLALIFVFVTSVVITSVVIADNKNQDYIWDEIRLDGEYYVGNGFSVPIISVSNNGATFETKFTLRFPSGKTYTDADNDNATVSEFILTESGVYTLKYYAEINSEIISKTVEFTVKEMLYSVSSEKSHIEYGEVSYDKVNGIDKITKTGLDLRLALGDSFNYNQVIDLSKKDELQKLLTFSVMPQVDRELDVSGITLILTDAYNAENRVEIKIKAIVDAVSESTWNVAYVSACAPIVGQLSTGYTDFAEPHVQVNTIYGREVYFPFYGSNWEKTYSALEHSVTINYNYDEKQIYVNNQLVVDLDDPMYFKQKLWSGFTTGEVFLSIVGNTYYKDTARFLITSLGENDVGENVVINKDSEPQIELDTMGIDLENAISVRGYKFPALKATAVDVYDGILPVTIRVFNGYYSSNRNELNIVDGYFTTDKLGVVTLEYSVCKRDGTVYKKLVDIQVKDESALKVILSSGYVTEGKAGDIIPLPEYSVEGQVGNVSSSLKVFFDNKEIAISDDNTFKTVSAGEYRVQIIAEDVIGQNDENSYVVTISENPDPMFFGGVIVPKYFIVGQTYTLPEFIAYDYSSNTEKEVKSKITINGVEGATFTPSNSGDVNIVYTAQTESGTAYKNYFSKAVKVKNESGELDFLKYFATNNLTASVDNKGVNFSAENSEVKTDCTFINYLNSYNFSVEFAVKPDKKSFKNIEIYLADVVNESKVIKISIDLSDNNKVYVNDSQTNIYINDDSLFDTTGKNSVHLELDMRTGILVVGVDAYRLENFADFFGSLLSLRFGFTDITGASEFSIRKIGNQVIKSTIKKDTSSPIVIYNGNYDVYKNLGETLTIYRAVISDVLMPIVDSYVSVKGPDGSFAVAKDGTVMNKVCCDKDYFIDLNMYGSYMIDYYAEDGAGQTAIGTATTLQVIDRVPPVITVENSTPKSAKIGDTVKIPAYVITDNVDTEFNVTVILTNSYEGLKKIWKDNEFVVNEKGTYTITILCYDKAGNMASATLTVKVEA